MKKELYATPAMVKEFRKSRKTSSGEMPDFPETLKLMQAEHALSEEPLPMPRLEGQMERAEFIRAYDRIPFSASLIFENLSIRQKERQSDVIFPVGRDVMCLQHIHDYGYREHDYHDYFSVTYLYQGRCNFMFEGQLLELKEGDLCIMTPEFRNAVHAYPDSFAFEAMIREDSFHIIFNDFLAAKSRLSDFLINAVRRKNPNYFVLHCSTQDEDLRFLLQYFVCETVKNDAYANTCAISLLKLFLGEAYRRYQNTMELFRNDFHQRRLDEDSMIRYIRNHYLDITLDQTAAYFHYNKTYLSRFIRQHFGRTFTELVTEMKMDHAREYLRNSNKHISDIALLVGYDTADHFSRMFRKIEGVSPAAYRKNKKNKK